MSFARNGKEDHRDSFQNYYLPNVEIKDFSVLIDGKGFFDLSVKYKPYKAIIEMSRSNGYTTGNLLDFDYFLKNYKLIAIDLSKQTKLKDPQQINFIGRLERQDKNNNNGATVFFIIEKSGVLLIFTKFCEHHIKMEIVNVKQLKLLNSSENNFSEFAT